MHMQHLPPLPLSLNSTHPYLYEKRQGAYKKKRTTNVPPSPSLLYHLYRPRSHRIRSTNLPVLVLISPSLSCPVHPLPPTTTPPIDLIRFRVRSSLYHHIVPLFYTHFLPRSVFDILTPHPRHLYPPFLDFCSILPPLMSFLLLFGFG